MHQIRLNQFKVKILLVCFNVQIILTKQCRAQTGKYKYLLANAMC